MRSKAQIKAMLMAVLTPEELEAHDREVACRAWYQSANECKAYLAKEGLVCTVEKDFETYWNERLKEKADEESK